MLPKSENMDALTVLVAIVVIVPRCFLNMRPRTASKSDVLNMLCQGLLPDDLFDTEIWRLNTLINL